MNESGAANFPATKKRRWVGIAWFLVLAVVAFLFYLHVLNRIDMIALDHREALVEELCKT